MADAPRRARRIEPGDREPLRNLDGAPIERVLVGAIWDDPSFDVDLCALLLGPDDRVADRTHFLYRRQREAPGGVGFVAFAQPNQPAQPDRAQVLLDLAALPASVRTVRTACSAMRSGTTLAAAGMLKTRTMDLATGQTTLVSLHPGDGLTEVSCLQLWEFTRDGDGWLVGMVGAGYPGGPPAFARDHGVRFD